MSEFYSATGIPAFQAALTSATVRAEFTAIAGGFAKLPTLAANGSKLVRVNAGATALEAVTALPIAQGGTGATTAAGARTAFGVGSGDSPTFAGLTIAGTALNVDNSGAATKARMGVWNSAGGVELAAEATTGNMLLGQLDASGVYQATYIEGVRNGGVILKYNDSDRLEVTSAGATITGDLVVTGNVTFQDGGVDEGVIGTMAARNVTIDSGAPTGTPADGEIWLRYA